MSCEIQAVISMHPQGELAFIIVQPIKSLDHLILLSPSVHLKDKIKTPVPSSTHGQNKNTNETLCQKWGERGGNDQFSLHHF